MFPLRNPVNCARLVRDGMNLQLRRIGPRLIINLRFRRTLITSPVRDGSKCSTGLGQHWVTVGRVLRQSIVERLPGPGSGQSVPGLGWSNPVVWCSGSPRSGGAPAHLTVITPRK